MKILTVKVNLNLIQQPAQFIYSSATYNDKEELIDDKFELFKDEKYVAYMQLWSSGWACVKMDGTLMVSGKSFDDAVMQIHNWYGEADEEQ